MTFTSSVGYILILFNVSTFYHVAPHDAEAEAIAPSLYFFPIVSIENPDTQYFEMTSNKTYRSIFVNPVSPMELLKWSIPVINYVPRGKSGIYWI